jgi:hypothetical protein
MARCFFCRALGRGCLLDPGDTHYVLGLMSHVIGAERWGIGSAGYPSPVHLAFKGGWGPNLAGDYQVRQTGIVRVGNKGYVLSIVALPASGSFDEGVAMVTAVARWAEAHVNLQDGPSWKNRPCGGRR